MSSLPAFLAIAILLIITPGPDMALVTRNALAFGRRAAMITALGIIVGLVAWTAASVAGLAALLATSADAFRIVSLLGAAYLVYLGARSLLAARQALPSTAAMPQPAAVGSAFRQGLVTNLLNPKIAVFFTSFIPQFVSPGPSATLESAVLALTFLLLGLAWLITLALVASSLARWLRRPRVQQAINAVTGVVLIGFGARTAAEAA